MQLPCPPGSPRWDDRALANRSQPFTAGVDRASVSRRLRVAGGSHGRGGHHNYPARLARSANPSPDRSSVRHHGRAGERPSTSRSADTSHLDSCAAFDPTQGGVYRRYFSRFHPPLPRIHDSLLSALLGSPAPAGHSTVVAVHRGLPRGRNDRVGASGSEAALASKVGGAEIPGSVPPRGVAPADWTFVRMGLCSVGVSADTRPSAKPAGGRREAGERGAGVGEKPTGGKKGGFGVILEVRVLLIALLLFGSTGSALCQVLCDQLEDSQVIAHVRPSEVAASDHAGCHGGGVPLPEPLSERSGESCEKGCCTALTHATVAPISSPGPASAASPMLACVDLGEVRARSDFLPKSRPAERLNSPFHFRNPPLLI